MTTQNSPAKASQTNALLAARRDMFNLFCLTLTQNNITYVILSGYQGYPDQIDSDVDFMVSEADFAKLPQLFKASQTHFGAPLIQILQHETTACYYIIAKQVAGHIAYLHPDSAASYRRKGRLWLHSEKVLGSRRKTAAGFWVPAAAVEFEYYFVKRIDKRDVELRHLQRLAALMAEDTAGCLAVLTFLMPPAHIKTIESAINQLDLVWFNQQKDILQVMLSHSLTKESFFKSFYNYIVDIKRQINRILQPTGLVVAVLGPDGSGKTTVIDHIETELAPAFRKVTRYHLRPHFDKQGTSGAVTNPHALPPRSGLAGFAKMVLFVLDYWWGYIRRIYPSKVRSTLVIFDRHFYDMLVDPARYRLPNNCWFTPFFAKLIPKPDLWLVLSAPPELLVSRKGELDLPSAKQLSAAYTNMTQLLPNAAIVNTGGSLVETYNNAITPVLTLLQKRIEKRLGAA